MEIQAIGSSSLVDAVLAALAEVAGTHPTESAATPPAGAAALGGGADLLSGASALSGLAGAAGLEGLAALATLPGLAVPGAPGLHAAPPGPLPVDAGLQGAVLQNLARPLAPPAAAAMPQQVAPSNPNLDPMPASTASTGSRFALPSDQLVNAAVIGLAVAPSTGWTPPPRARPAEPEPAEAPPRRAQGRDPDAHDDRPDAPDDAAATDDAPDPPRTGSVQGAGTDDDWAGPLSQALREALRGPVVPEALQAALQQWQLGRCVLLACPRGADPAGAAWAHVLWPRAGSRHGLPLALSGVRVDARLQWARVPPAPDWCHARLMKEQHPRQGRQLVALDATGTASIACEVQLGPVPLRTPRWRDACVRIDAAGRVWSALRDQWSVTLVVSARPVHLPRSAQGAA